MHFRTFAEQNSILGFRPKTRKAHRALTKRRKIAVRDFKKYHNFLINFKKSDWEQIQNRASICKMSPTKYIREMALNGEIKFYNNERINELSVQLSHIGTNINQIVHLANKIRSVNKTDIESLELHMKRIDEAINDWCKPFNYEVK
jgi:hypothetical protein